MPRAGIVAAARQEVSDMKAQLAALMGGAAAASAGVSDGALTDDELAEKARQAFLEVERMLGQKTGTSSRRDDATAIAVLEAENERLRVEATALLVRQQQLEELVASVIAKGKAAASNN
ncbi:hypothetical protein CHLRE_02g092451v5 [Chlamydomonas reinhardtii]|uniref:Uncharacterized protein n=1 Tax=Chlamydomonas reinhardtii TaxID=3055 RepID=A0A2K3E184_CHLRE|nr:uncharacterized protein CHLRE_02g092451v5 [Chlamydomonas reinhardtii]PNW86580.1 hypothetical protein CHLRE_02g092451v5 [Chlamydomonas reinhardtii]